MLCSLCLSQAAARGKASRTQALAEEEAASAIQKQFQSSRQRDFFQNRLSVEQECECAKPTYPLPLLVVE